MTREEILKLVKSWEIQHQGNGFVHVQSRDKLLDAFMLVQEQRDRWILQHDHEWSTLTVSLRNSDDAAVREELTAHDTKQGEG